MEILKQSMFAFLSTLSLTVLLVHAQNQSGFISIDCGIPENSGYTDKITGIQYTSDAAFIDTGVSYNISQEYNTEILENQFLRVRSFPEGTKNCYTLKPERSHHKFFIRARFMYGNYDGQGKVPNFDLLLEADVWDSVELEDASTVVTKEIIHVPKKSFLYVCLVNKGRGTPFISALELRPLDNLSYATEAESLQLLWRWDVGLASNGKFRYKDDAFDRIWSSSNSYNWTSINTSLSVFLSQNWFKPPSNVMRTAAIPEYGNNSLDFSWKPIDPASQYYVCFHFAEFRDNLEHNQTIEQEIYLNGFLWNPAFKPPYLSPYTLYSDPLITSQKIEFSIRATKNSTLPPILNGFEIYRVKEFQQLLTDQEDVDAIMNIKSKYGVKRSDWQGDPCAPKNHSWPGLNCSYDDYDPPRIISLNLSSSGISGEISPYISSLKLIQSLDLSNNSLVGPVPDFLAQLPFLTVLNLRENKLRGSVPPVLTQRKEDGLLSLSVDGNPELCPEASCEDKNKLKPQTVVIPIVSTIFSIGVILTAIAILWSYRRRKQARKNKSTKLKNQMYKSSDLVKITNNFERVLGKGGFGTVYHGYLEDTQVAVKMFSESSNQGYKEFNAEVELLTRVHHKNLTALVGYCNDRTNMALLYEFMANGNLQSHLLENDADIMSWEGRLRIATEAAQGLEYLHSGCKPPIVHRDVKSTNILLNEKFQAKLADFGLSRIFPIESGTHVSTIVAGTPGYLDPEYHKSNRLTEKSDVYSFGVVILEIITGKPVIENTLGGESIHISHWVSCKLSEGDIHNIVDGRLQGDFDTNSAWKAVEIAMACVSPTSANRPTMNQVVIELNESLANEIARVRKGHEAESKDTSISVNWNLNTELSPLAR